MVTKDCWSQKDKHKTFVDSVSNIGFQFTDLNLNQKSQKFLQIEHVQAKSFSTKNTKGFKVTNYVSDDVYHKNDLKRISIDSRSKSLNGLHLQSSEYFNAYILTKEEDQKQWKKDKKEFSSKSKNASTLSLHIAAYENYIEAENLKDCDKLTFNLFKKDTFKNQNGFKENFDNSTSTVCFEFPRQNRHKTTKPEVMQFKASQKLINPTNGAVQKTSDDNKQAFGTIQLPLTLKKEKLTTGEWGIYFHRDTGKFYYTNSATHESTWKRPDEVLIYEERRAFIKNFIDFQLENGDDNKIPFQCHEYLQKVLPNTYLGDYFCNMDEEEKRALISRCCVESFVMLLDEKMLEKDDNKKLKINMSWESVSKLLNSDRRFHLITRPSEKKAIFNKWKESAPAREKRTKEFIFENQCTMFTQQMSAHKSFNSNLDYSTASEIFAAEKFWTSVPVEDRRAVFEEVMKRIQKRIEKEEEKYRKENIQSLANILKDMQTINCETTWAQAQRLLAQNHNFQGNSSLMNMDKEDALCVFATHIRRLIEEYREMKNRNKITQFRKERKMREKFQDLLVELRRRDIITLKTKWKDISPLICKEDRFNDLLTQSGPTPIDFFKFYMIDWNAEFKNNLDFVLELMEEKNFDFTLSTTYEAFVAFVEPNSKPLQVNKDNYQYIYDSLLRDLIERTSKQDNAAEKLRQTFVTQLKKLESNPDVNIRDVDSVSRYFKARWHISENVEAIVLKLREEYLGQEEGELPSESSVREKRLSDSSRSCSPHNSKKKAKKEKKNRKRLNSSDHEHSKKKKHRRRRSSSVEDNRRYREDSPSHRNHKSFRKY